MGYYVQITSANMTIENEQKEEVLARWKEMNSPIYDKNKHGGTHTGGKKIESNYSWMPTDYDKTVNNPQDVLTHLGFEFTELTNGNIQINSYDSKTGQEDLFFKKIADLIKPGQYMNWSGEDGATYAWYFDGKAMLETSPNQAINLSEKVMEQNNMEKAPINPFKKTKRYLV